MFAYYRRDGSESTLAEFARLTERDRRVALTKIGEVEVSTVFLGIDHGFESGLPILFETMVFGGEHDQQMDRYSTEEAALDGHRATVKQLKAAQRADMDAEYDDTNPGGW